MGIQRTAVVKLSAPDERHGGLKRTMNTFRSAAQRFADLGWGGDDNGVRENAATPRCGCDGWCRASLTVRPHSSWAVRGHQIEGSQEVFNPNMPEASGLGPGEVHKPSDAESVKWPVEVLQ
jgi:hypothetical protein